MAAINSALLFIDTCDTSLRGFLGLHEKNIIFNNSAVKS